MIVRCVYLVTCVVRGASCNTAIIGRQQKYIHCNMCKLDEQVYGMCISILRVGFVMLAAVHPNLSMTACNVVQSDAHLIGRHHHQTIIAIGRSHRLLTERQGGSLRRCCL